MSKEKERPDVSKRFFVQGTEALQKKLQHLAIDLNTSAEKLAGVLLADAVNRAEGDLDAARTLLGRSVK